MLKVNNLNYAYQTFAKQNGFVGELKDLFHRQIKEIPALKNISFEFPDQSMIGLVGPNGAGKTTLVKILTGILPVTSGEVTIDGQIPSTSDNAFLRSIGVMFGQKSQLSWDLPASDTLYMLSKIYNLGIKQYQERLNELTEVLNTKDFFEVPVRKLSLGQRVRCEMMCALIHSPKYVFLDEPTLGLDLLTQNSIYEFLKHENSVNGTTIIITSHNIKDIAALADNLMIIDHGELMFNDKLKNIPVDYQSHDKFAVKLQAAADSDQTIDLELTQEELKGQLESGKLTAENIITISKKGVSLEEYLLDVFQKAEK